LHFDESEMSRIRSESSVWGGAVAAACFYKGVAVAIAVAGAVDLGPAAAAAAAAAAAGAGSSNQMVQHVSAQILS
jgi:hypothetical protein